MSGLRITWRCMPGPGACPGGEGSLTDTPRIRAPVSRQPDGRTRVKIVIPDDHSMVSLLGSRDELLHVIEDAFGADIHVRGNEITVTGSPEETALVARLFDELTSCWRAGPSSPPTRSSAASPCCAASRAPGRPRC